jgi:hypothetical protein
MSVNSWEFITRTVPKEALARGKPLEKPRTQGLPWGRSKTFGSSKEVVPPCNSLSRNVVETFGRMKTYPVVEIETYQE